MEKGNYGIRLAFYGVAAFVLAFMGWTTGLFLLLGVVVLAEKSEWASRQVLQATFLCVLASFISSALALLDIVTYIPFVSSIWYTFKNIVNDLVDIAVFVFIILGIIKNLKGEDAKLPLISNMVDWVYGIVRPKAVKVQPQAQVPYCTGCGVPLTGGAFCNTCGKPVGQPAAPAQAAPAPAAAPEQPQQ